ncbi:MAG: helix-turn-helix domain-containing protein [Paracoccaceae bacterium]|nr:helix-turn-helix domain-containing protein [Paracoccaceae bacterium]
MRDNRELLHARAALESGDAIDHSATPENIAHSWQRCREMGLDPGAMPEDAVVSSEALRTILQDRQRFIHLVRPELELLSTQIAGTNFMCAFADENGVVLDTIMDAEFSDSDCARSVVTGSVWSEDVRGTNALGLALSTGRTSMVTGAEHYFGCHSAVACVATPIRGSDGRIVGLLDASSELAERQYHTRALINLAATNIENRLFAQAHWRDIILQFHPRDEYLATQSAGLIAFDEAGRITGANRNAIQFLSPQEDEVAERFDALFRGDFGTNLRTLEEVGTTRLWDRLGSAFFARLHPESPQRPGRTTRAFSGGRRVESPLARRTELREHRFVFDDEMARECRRVAISAATLGQPICLRGAAGTGKTALAEAVHHHLNSDAPLIVLDCRDLRGARHDRVLEDILAQAPDALTGSGGTLVLEAMSAIPKEADAYLDRLLSTLRDAPTAQPWCIVATQRTRPNEIGGQVVAQASETFLAVDLPLLADRTDFDKIARSLLTAISPQHKLSKKALKALSEMDRPANLRDLRHHLRLLAASFPSGVLRDVQLDRVFPSLQRQTKACGRCNDAPIRRRRCIGIRQTVSACQGNVALASRRLGVSRNTVYAHLKD